MKNINNKLILLIGLMVFAFSNVAQAQKKMWEGKSYNFAVTNNAGNSYAWTTSGLASGLTVTTSSGASSNSYNVTFDNSNASTGVGGTLNLRETNASTCYNDNTLNVVVYNNPTFTAMTAANFCNGNASALTSVNIKLANFSEVKGITGNGDSLTLNYEVYSAGISVGGAGSIKILTGSSAATDNVSLSASQLATLQTFLNTQGAGSYSVVITGVSTFPTTPVTTEAGAVNSTYFTSNPNVKVIDITINAVPAANAITPTN